jgi:hypothetical protein
MNTGIIRSKQYNRTLNLGGAKPSQMTHVRLGGWAEVYVGEEPLHESRVVFGYVEAIIGEQIQLRIADTVFSAKETGLANGDLLDLELGDLASSEFSPAVQESKTRLRRRARRRCSA